jgi:hypothetical protein
MCVKCTTLYLTGPFLSYPVARVAAILLTLIHMYGAPA